MTTIRVSSGERGGPDAHQLQRAATAAASGCSPLGSGAAAQRQRPAPGGAPAAARRPRAPRTPTARLHALHAHQGTYTTILSTTLGLSSRQQGWIERPSILSL